VTVTVLLAYGFTGPLSNGLEHVNAAEARFYHFIKASVVARQILSPLDMEREFGLVGGDIFHGAWGSIRSTRRARYWAMRTTARASRSIPMARAISSISRRRWPGS
jgi:hypothetical protein